MKAISLLYHDIVDKGDFDSSGFLWPGAARYKLDVDDFGYHVDRIERTIDRLPELVSDHLKKRDGKVPLFLTFDDGGASAVQIVDILESKGWVGHFFITTEFINERTFVSENDIREIARRGHLIGSHSRSHPKHMSGCSRERLLREWTDSRRRLSDLLGQPILAASSPGGYYSREVAETAALAGFRALFISEPTLKCHHVDDCLVLGRYTIWRGMSGRYSAELAAGKFVARLKQSLTWKAKKLIKSMLGRYWFKIRKEILK